MAVSAACVLSGAFRHKGGGQGRSKAGVAAQIHRRCPRMVGAALEDHLDTSDTGDGRNDAKVDAALFENDALLDMQFEEGCNVIAPRRFEPARIATDASDRMTKHFSGLVAIAELLCRQHAAHGAAADTGKPELAGLLRKEIHDLDRMPERATGGAQGPGDFQRAHHTGDAVKAPACRNRVGMRADHDRARMRIGAFHASDQVAAGIDAHGKACLGKTVGQPCPPFQEARRKRTPRIGHAGIGYRGQFHQVGPEPVTVDGEVCLRSNRCFFHGATGRDGVTKRPKPGSARTCWPSKTMRPRRKVATGRYASSIPS